jgi:biopolymer transport protein ExbD
VFFLLVNQSSTEELPSPDIIKLPDSVAEQKPEQTIVVMITPDSIMVQGQAVAAIDEVMAREDTVIPAVRDVLRAEAGNIISVSGAAAERNRQVTIMGDKQIPFKLLKKVMASCTAAGYQRISLAVQQKET